MLNLRVSNWEWTCIIISQYHKESRDDDIININRTEYWITTTFVLIKSWTFRNIYLSSVSPSILKFSTVLVLKLRFAGCLIRQVYNTVSIFYRGLTRLPWKWMRGVWYLHFVVRLWYWRSARVETIFHGYYFWSTLTRIN